MTKDKNESKKEEAPKKMWKIEGEAFEKVKAARAECRAAKEEAARIAEEAHNKFWDTIHEAVPEADRDANLEIDPDYEEAGFYMLKECKKGDSSHAPDIIGKILAAAAKGAVKVKIGD